MTQLFLLIHLPLVQKWAIAVTFFFGPLVKGLRNKISNFKEPEKLFLTFCHRSVYSRSWFIIYWNILDLITRPKIISSTWLSNHKPQFGSTSLVNLIGPWQYFDIQYIIYFTYNSYEWRRKFINKLARFLQAFRDLFKYYSEWMYNELQIVLF